MEGLAQGGGPEWCLWQAGLGQMLEKQTCPAGLELRGEMRGSRTRGRAGNVGQRRGHRNRDHDAGVCSPAGGVSGATRDRESEGRAPRGKGCSKHWPRV